MTTRRSFLAGAGALTAAGLLGLPRLAHGDSSAPKRLILFYTPHGTVWNDWRPSGSETNFTLGPILNPLQAFKDRMAIVDGLQIRSPYDHRVPHTYDLPALWTGSPVDTESALFHRSDHGVSFGWNLGTSVDQYISQALPQTTPHRSLQFALGVAGPAHPARRMIYSGPGAYLDPIDGANLAWYLLFSSLQGGTPPSLAAQRASILDHVTQELASVRAKVSPADRARIDAHTTAIRDLEVSLSANVVCDVPPNPGVINIEDQIDAQLEIMVAALACGLTNVASYQHRVGDNDNSPYPWLGLTTGGHHLTTHDTSTSGQAMLTTIYTHYAERFAHLLRTLDSYPEGAGTMLDNTLVIWGTEIGKGYNHDVSNVPFVVAGGPQTGLRGGRYLDLRGQGYGHNRLLVSACHAMGLPSVETYGLTDLGSGGVPGLIA